MRYMCEDTVTRSPVDRVPLAFWYILHFDVTCDLLQDRRVQDDVVLNDSEIRDLGIM